MKLQLCVLLWAIPGQADALTDYENTVLALLPRYGGRVVSRVRRTTAGDGPIEVQLIHLPDDAALQSYLKDPARVALAGVHGTVVQRTEMFQTESLM